jgi:hypothetical protein
MEKTKLLKFVSKYHLAGLIESVKWESESSTLKTSFISDDKSVLGTVMMKDFGDDTTTYGIYDTSKLVKMLSVLGEDVTLNLNTIDGKLVSLKFNDKSSTINYMLSDLSVIPTVPDLKKLPEFNVQIKLDDKFINKFIRAKSALSEEDNFTFMVKDGVAKIILGYASINSNRISIEVDASVTEDVDPISFSATYLKEILVANKDATNAVLDISTQGLAAIHFDIDNYTSDYYLVQISN